jgi:hypothetical protein
MTLSLPTISFAFFWRRSGELVELGALPGKTMSYATGINDVGQLVGYSR